MKIPVPDLETSQVILPEKQQSFLKKKEKRKLLELGSGQGRDTCFFVSKGFHVHSLDYTENGLKLIKEKIENMGLLESIVTLKHDVRDPIFHSKTKLSMHVILICSTAWH